MADVEELSMPLGDLSEMSEGHAARDQDDFNDNSMDTDSEGGVQIITTPRAENSTETLHAKILYHQAPVSELDSSSYKWKLPVSPVLYEPKRLKHSQDHPIVKAYQKHCGIITKHWNCHPNYCIPLEVRDYTPYSLAMLCSLRRLACDTKQNFVFAQSQLLEAWQRRTGQCETSGSSNLLLVERLFTNRSKYFKVNHESKIQENLVGLTVEDVDNVVQAIRRARSEKRRANKARNGALTQRERSRANKAIKAALKPPQHIAGRLTNANQNLFLNELLPPSIAERVIGSRKQDREAKPTAAHGTDFEDELVDVEISTEMDEQSGLEGAFAVPPNSPVSTYKRRNPFALDVALREIGNRHHERAGRPDQDEEVLFKPSNRNRPDDQIMSNILNRLDIDTRRDIKKKKRLRELQARGQSRIEDTPVERLSEKIRLDSAPSPQSIDPPARATDLAECGQLPLPDQTPFTLPVRTRPSGVS